MYITIFISLPLYLYLNIYIHVTYLRGLVGHRKGHPCCKTEWTAIVSWWTTLVLTVLSSSFLMYLIRHSYRVKSLLLLFRKNVSVCFHHDLWTKFHFTCHEVLSKVVNKLVIWTLVFWPMWQWCFSFSWKNVYSARCSITVNWPR